MGNLADMQAVTFPDAKGDGDIPADGVGGGEPQARVGASRLEGVGHPKQTSRRMGWEIWRKLTRKVSTPTCRSCWRMMMMRIKRGRAIRVEKNPQPLGSALVAIGGYTLLATTTCLIWLQTL